MPLVYLPDVESLFLWGEEPVPRVARERVVPTITRRAGRIEARWASALAGRAMSRYAREVVHD